MNIALMSHDNKKELMVQFCIAYCGIQLFLAHAQGGSQQIGARIAYDEIDMVLFFNDPTSDELDKDMSYIINLCDQHNVPIATNAASAEMLIHGLARGDLDWRLILKPTSPLKV